MKELTRPKINSGESLAEKTYIQEEYTEEISTEPISNGRVITKPSPNGTGSSISLLPKLEIPETRMYVSEEEYWNTYYDCADGNYEWNNGYLEEIPMASVIKFRMYVWFLELLKDYLHVYDMGLLTGLEIGFRLQLAQNRIVIRKPDLGVVLRNNPVQLNDDDRTYKGIFDICIESLSDSTPAEIERDTVHKKDEYAQAGVPEYYILDDTGKETVFYSLNSSGIYVPIQPVNGIIQSTIMPGFQFRVADLYSLPRVPMLATDSVYSGYASPEYRAAREQAQQEYERAEEERQRADEAEQRAEEEYQQTQEARQRADEAEQRAEEEHQQTQEARQRADEAEQRAEKARLYAEEAKLRIAQTNAQAEKWAEQLRAAGIVPTGLENQ